MTIFAELVLLCSVGFATYIACDWIFWIFYNMKNELLFFGLKKHIELVKKTVEQEIKQKNNEQKNNDMMEKKLDAINDKILYIEKELDTYLDKTFMLTGFEPFTGIPYYTTNYDKNNKIVVRKSLLNYWETPMYGKFVVRQFAGCDAQMDD